MKRAPVILVCTEHSRVKQMDGYWTENSHYLIEFLQHSDKSIVVIAESPCPLCIDVARLKLHSLPMFAGKVSR